MNYKVYLAAIIGGVVATNIFLVIRDLIEIKRITDDMMMYTYPRVYGPSPRVQ